jgi:hypothetical protein
MDIKEISAHSGWFRIATRKNKDGTIRWYPKFEYKGENGKKTEVAVPKKAYHHFGFNESMGPIEAKHRAKQLNKERRSSNKALIGAVRRHDNDVQADETYFPQHQLADFLVYLEECTHGTSDRLKKVRIHFGAAQRLVKDTKLTPDQYAFRSSKIYKWFVDKKYSLDYAESILRVLNLWGKYVCKLRGQFYDPVKNPRGRVRTSIQAAYSAKGKRAASRPITPNLLVGQQNNFKPLQYNWLYLTVWLGLRPGELNNIQYEVRHDTHLKVDVLSIFQPKLAHLPEEERWKHIPIIYPEQVRCLELLQSREFERPLAKTVSKYLGQDYHLYGGRKCFTDLMLDRGQDLVDISMWLGHRSIDRTWKNYKDKTRVRFKKTPGMLRAVKK